MRVKWFLLLIVFNASCLWDGPSYDLTGVDTRLTILHTADIHSRLLPFRLVPLAGDKDLGLDEANAPFGGAARLGYVIQRERARASRSLHLDSGDCFQGAPIFNQNLGEAELRFLGLMGLDAMVIGNHEFDAGVTNLTQKLRDFATFDVLAANYSFKDPTDPNNNELGDYALPYAIYNVQGLKIGVIGMGNLSSLTSIGEGGNSLGITPLQQNETVRSYVNFLHGSVDLIVVLSHLGLEEDQELLTGYEIISLKERIPPHWEIKNTLPDGRVEVFVPGVRGIDLIVGGHMHTVTNPPKVVTDLDGREVIIMHSGAFAKYLGRLDLVVEDDEEQGGKRIASHKFQVIPIDERLAPYEDINTTELLEPYILDLNQNLDLQRVIGYAPKTVLRRSDSGDADSGLGNMVAESMRKRRRVEAEFSITNTLGIRDNFYRGPITMEDMFNVFPFENTITIMYLSGREIQEVFDFSTDKSASRGCQSQVQVAGVSVVLNCAQTLKNEQDPSQFKNSAQEIKINGVPLNINGMYKVALNDYIAAGGSGFRMLKRNTTKLNTGVSLRDALIDYVATLPNCAQYEKNRGRFCEASDEYSQSICAQIGDYGRIPNNLNAKGPYADFPCIIGEADGRLKRVVSDNLDTLPSDGEAEEVP